MALFSKRTKRTSRRALRKAHTKTLKAQAKAEKAFHAKATRKQAKVTRKADELASAAAKKAAKQGRGARAAVTDAGAATKELSGRAQKKAAKARRKQATSTARTYLGIATTVAPVLAPFAYRAATALRGQLDARRARAIGVGVEQLGQFSGHGAGLSARIAGLEPALAGMADTHLAPADVTFRETTTARLAELSTAVHAAERMPTPRRKSAHRSVAADLDRIDAELLHRLGVR